tara:strand:- start:300 stop:629 length:330 start_codon:yes stop_codon:yes gene_type:complete
MSQFISEAYRVLRSGGHFAWTDFRDKKTMESIHKQFLSTGFEIELQSDITEEVVSALDQVSDDKQSRIKNGTNVIIRRSFETFAGVRNTPVYDAFIKGDLGYYRYLLRK